MMHPPFSMLVGKTLTSIAINANRDEVELKARDGSEYKMFHCQDCCETVDLNDIVGDLGDILESPILLAEEVSNEDATGGHESATWTFYKLATVKGRVTLRWLGVSNGYYSERVDFVQTKPATP